MTKDSSTDMEAFRKRGENRFPGLLGVEVLDVRRGETRMRIALQPHHVAPNGYLHAGVVVGLADTASGYGCVASLPEGATGFTTIELKTNFLGTLTEGALTCTARMVHGGRTTQIWDAEVLDEVTGKRLALFRCTQLVLYPRD